MAKYLIDTNILIDHLRGDPQAARFLRDVETGRVRAMISVATECELLASPVLTTRDERRITTLLELLPRVAVTSHIAQLAAKLRRRYQITIADALIAATALQSHATLLTRNLKDFQPIRELDVQALSP
ncbi:MAG: type II toxin-antitoxin system VapC family toxin [Candidatus Omnitrophica bacterium]|nr:type II toxin-antitoxin system VapC family toxin [Candidatus Omnitrophota bacterium]MBI3011777.1 type II toxin-antitoxin system VapC family toxin [Candidatus Omnitrophota bacterium]